MELFRKSFSEHLKFASAMAAEQRPELRPNLLAPLRLCSEMAFVGTRSREWPDDTSGDKKRGLRTIDAEIDVRSQEWMDVLSVTRTDPRARADWSSAIPGIRHRDSLLSVRWGDEWNARSHGVLEGDIGFSDRQHVSLSAWIADA
jgi:hypothetical protein